MSSAVADSHITADGSGNETLVSVTLTSSGTGLTVQHNAQVSGNMTISGTETVAGAATFNGAGTGLTVAHNASINGNLTVNGSLIGGGLSIPNINSGFLNTVTNSGVTVNHGLGGTPSFVCGQVVGGTGLSGSVVTYVTNLTSSTFLLSTNTVSGWSVYWIAVR